MKTCLLPHFRPALPGAPLPSASVLTPPSAPNAVAQPLRANCARNSVLSEARISTLRHEFNQARPIGYLTRLIAAAKAQADCIAAAVELKMSVLRLLRRAQTEEWSQRELARRAGIPESSFRRIRAGHADPLTWLPKLQTALEKLNPS